MRTILVLRHTIIMDQLSARASLLQTKGGKQSSRHVKKASVLTSSSSHAISSSPVNNNSREQLLTGRLSQPSKRPSSLSTSSASPSPSRVSQLPPETRMFAQKESMLNNLGHVLVQMQAEAEVTSHAWTVILHLVLQRVRCNTKIEKPVKCNTKIDKTVKCNTKIDKII